MVDLLFSKNFKYKHNNPYHDRLGAYDSFVMRDHEAETNKSKWATDIFKNSYPIELEIGTGYGNFMQDYCKNNPNINFIGLDYRFKRSFQLAKKLKDNNSSNFRYLRAKGERIHHIFDANELDTIYYFFPDPWPKTRHHKKRLFQTPFLESAYKVLKPNGTFYIKTDHDDYAKWMHAVLEKNPFFKIDFYTQDLYGEFPEHFLSNYQTRFEHIFIKKGINIKAFVLKSLKDKK